MIASTSDCHGQCHYCSGLQGSVIMTSCFFSQSSNFPEIKVINLKGWKYANLKIVKIHDLLVVCSPFAQAPSHVCSVFIPSTQPICKHLISLFSPIKLNMWRWFIIKDNETNIHLIALFWSLVFVSGANTNLCVLYSPRYSNTSTPISGLL